ncbi:TraB/GumN family protein [Flavihumibacter stibioxidans]|uniref:TraB/GumN family protein n=1 Tax=Flavihumibacter stibioxidans TaxID=1834163 RepID=A0ABR7M6H3_9BACT|nr:TraB/GumN family protein [Flavihumibacter stibioxidans]MBC6490636.1 hypothetical protein [Flavihumibacter stibioxidans]
MPVRRTVLILVLLVLLQPLFLQAQEPIANTMLWRITGKNLSAPSYLFGTMHLQDRRLFQFGDSVYAGIRNTQGFAAELDLEQLGNAVIESMMQERENGKGQLLSEMLSAEQKKKYAAALEKKFRKKYDRITYGELKSRSDGWMYSLKKKDDMSTFMDAWLFDFARREGKWVGGLEDMEDQMSIARSNLATQIEQVLQPEKEKQQFLDKFIRIYADGKLSQLNDIVQETSGYLGAYKINQRNFKMAQRIDSLSAIRTGFYAVGAAHLPGDSGVIKLLRKQGYQVEPVYSTARLDPDKQLPAERLLDWQKVQDPDSSYSVWMPGKPSLLNKIENLQAAQIYFDFFTMSAYFTATVDLPGVSENQIDSIASSLGKMYKEKGKLLADSVRKFSEFSARYIQMVVAEGKGFMTIHSMPGKMVMNMIFSQDKNLAEGKDAERFFSSMTINRRETAKGIREWRYNREEQSLISFEVPVELKREVSLSDSVWKELSFSGLDVLKQIYYMVKVYESQPGYFSSLDSGYFENVISQAVANGDSRLISRRNFKMDGFPAAEALLGMRVDGDTVHSHFSLLNRGNRRYLFVSSYAPGDSRKEDAQRFLHSVRLLPYREPRNKVVQITAANFTTSSPALFVADGVALENGNRKFMMYDSVSAVSAHVDIEPLSKYYWSESDSSFLREQTQLYVTSEDSLLTYKTSRSNGKMVADAVIRHGETHNLKRVRLFANGDTVYAMYAFLPAEIMNSQSYRELFDGFRVIGEVKKHSYTESKARLLLADLLLPDSIIFSEASEALSRVHFGKEDIPFLQKAILYPYADFSPNRYCTHDELIQVLLDARDPSTTGFIPGAFLSLKERNSELQYPLLSVLTRTQTRESFETLKALLKKGLPTSGYANILNPSITDSLELTGILLPELLDYCSDSLFVRMMPDVLLKLYDSAKISRAQLDSVLPYMLALGKNYADSMKADTAYFPNGFNRFCNLLALYNDKASLNMLRGFAESSNIDVVNAVVTAMLARKLVPDESWRLRLAKDDYYRMHLYQDLMEKDKLSLFPNSYARQPQLAASHLFNTIWEDYDIRTVTFLSEQKHLIDGENKRFYLFRVVVGNGDEQMNVLGVAGPYEPSGKVSNSIGSLTGLHTEAVLEEKKVLEQFRDFLNQSQQ